MKHCKLTKDAENDLREIARYTLKTWGKEKFYEYRDGLKDTFDAIGNSKIIRKPFSKLFPELCVTKYRYHFIFYFSKGFEKPVIIGVIHEKRNKVKYLSERLS